MTRIINKPDALPDFRERLGFGKNAEDEFVVMLHELGYQIEPVGQETAISDEFHKLIRNNRQAEVLRHTPDFAVVSPTGNFFTVQVASAVNHKLSQRCLVKEQASIDTACARVKTGEHAAVFWRLPDGSWIGNWADILVLEGRNDHPDDGRTPYYYIAKDGMITLDEFLSLEHSGSFDEMLDG